MSAKTLQGPGGVRAKSKPENTRLVYKNVVGSPFLLKWPTLLPNLSENVLTELLKALQPISDYKKAVRENKKKGTLQTRPELCSRLYIGLNQVTKYLESYIDKKRTSSSVTDTQPIIYICKREIKPVLLCQHILTMAAIANIRLAQMPAGAENKIGKALGIRRAAVVIMEVKQDEEVLFRLDEMPTVNAPWLEGALALEPVYAHVASKTLQTTAPMTSKKRKMDDEQSTSNKKPCIEK